MRYQRIYRIFLPVLLSTVLLAGCNKYLDVKPKGYTLLTTVSDYDQWLNDATVTGFSIAYQLNLLGDNEDNVLIPAPPEADNDLIYTWAPNFSTAPNVSPLFWGTHYAAINSYNTLLQGIGTATGGTELQRKSLRAEALLGRAIEYFYLVNEYGKAYDSTTAAQDPGVPFVTSNDVAQQVPPRSSVKVVYDNIIADIQAAIPDLPPDNSKNRLRGSVAAAYSVLARLYLNVGNYSAARTNAQLALERSLDQTMINYNNILTAVSIPALLVRPDAIYARASTSYPAAEIPTLEHLRSFDKNDARLRLFYSNLGNFSFTQRGATVFYPGGYLVGSGMTNFGTSIQEMKLIIAEVAARNNELTVALQQLDEVRKNRIPSANYQPYQSTDKAFVLQKVLDERRFEFAYNGLRWFDMRRFNKDGLMPAVNRYDARGNVIATLAPRSTKYVLQIPLQVSQFNPGMEQNPQ